MLARVIIMRLLFSFSLLLATSRMVSAEVVDFSHLFDEEDVAVLETDAEDVELSMPELVPDSAPEQEIPDVVTESDVVPEPVEPESIYEAIPEPAAVIAAPGGDADLEQLLLVRDRQIEELKFALEELTDDYSRRVEQMRSEESPREVREVVEARTQLEVVQFELQALQERHKALKTDHELLLQKLEGMDQSRAATDENVAMLQQERNSLIAQIEERDQTIAELLTEKNQTFGAQVSKFEAQLEEKALALAQSEGRIRAEYETRMQQMEAENARKIASLTSEHSSTISRMVTSHEAALNDLQAEQKEKLSMLQQEYTDEREKMRETHQARLDALQLEFDTFESETSEERAAAEKLRSEVKRLEAALQVARRENERERFMLAYNSGALFLAAGRYDRAEREFLKALDVRENDAALHYNMGILYDEHIDRPEKARFHYKRFLELAPSDRDAPTVQQWLRELQ